MSVVDAAFLSDGELRKPEAGKFRTILPQVTILLSSF